MTTSQQIQDDLAPMLGTVLGGKYRLDTIIGGGGMGAVFRGHHLQLRRDVAIKVLQPECSGDSELVKRFDREARCAARLDHPNCVRAIEYGTTEDGTRYLVMELLEGVELQQLVEGPVEPRRALDLILQVVRGLEHAHGQGLVHRDLKPQNILVTREPEGRELLKIVDFGIVKIVHGEGAQEVMTRAGMVFGTPQYMSPEQAQGQEIDARADLYAVGVLLYTLVAGKLPFNSDNLIALIYMQVMEPPPPLPAAVPGELAAIILRLLAKSKDHRFADAGALRMALERCRGLTASGNTTDGYAASAPDLANRSNGTPLPDALRPRTLRLLDTVVDGFSFHRRPWLRIALGAGLIIGLIIGVLLLLWLRS